ncbi:RNA-binding protein [Salinimonas marina]|uniref:RNA-binding protein n=1 Tax=Salinimonas marina TaxID=2785918 RepID=A0A7S9HDN4_9ALTE|nr:RNA-binding protein [Salinimonas marina]QPG06456.1 RNA-binding protein [Salinimonas marina]
MKILVRNLDRTTTEAELTNLFSAYGVVQSCNLVMDQKTGQSKGFAFVEMPKPGDAKAAIKNLNNQGVGETKIRVKKADDKKADAENASDAPSSGKD